MTMADVERMLQRAHEQYPDARPRTISDNGPQFTAKDFKQFIRMAGMTHVRSPWSAAPQIRFSVRRLRTRDAAFFSAPIAFGALRITMVLATGFREDSHLLTTTHVYSLMAA